MKRLLARLLTLLGRNANERRLREEIENHLTLETEVNIRKGLPLGEARRQAVLKFGAIEGVKEAYREQRKLPLLETLFHDILHAAHLLRKSPAFTVAAVLTLALGMGATSSIFTLVHAVLLKSLPVARPGQLYRLGKKSSCCVDAGYRQEPEHALFSYEEYTYFRDHTQGFEQLAAFQAGQQQLGVRRVQGGKIAESYFGEFVSGNYFEMFGIGAYAGRRLSDDDDRPGAAPAVMMSYRVWQMKYAGDPGIIGGAFALNGKPVTVVGVTPPGFYGDQLRPSPPDFFVPLAMEPSLEDSTPILRQPDVMWLDVIGRARAGTNPAVIEAQMRVELRQWLTLHAGAMQVNARAAISKATLNLAPGGAGISAMREEYEHWLQILMLVSGFVLLIVCANVANLMLVRGIERRPQIALSMALGARPARLVHQALTESLTLALLGGAMGLTVAFSSTRLILHFAFPDRSGIPIQATPSVAVLLFAFGVALITGVVFGVAPARMATQVDPIEALRGTGRATLRTASIPRKMLVVLQAALSLVLLSAAGLLSAALWHLEHQNFGFEQEARTVVNVDPLLAGYKPEQLDLLFRRLHDALVNVPGIASAGSCLYSPMNGDSWNWDVYPQGAALPGQNVSNVAWFNRVSPGYFDVIGNPIVRGRGIEAWDSAQSRRVAVINEEFARRFFPNQDPIGKHFGKTAIEYSGEYEIVGVAKDARYLTSRLDKPVVAFYFLPESQTTHYKIFSSNAGEISSHYLHDLVIRTQPGAHVSEAALREAIASVDPNLPIVHVDTLVAQVGKSFSQQRLIARLTSLFGLLALVLASIGIYGITAYNVGRRKNEIGVRMALGADRRNVFALVLQGAFALIAFGLLVGVPLTFATARLLAHQLYGVNPYDLRVMLAAMVALAVPALIAAMVPAHRASSIEPMRALRTE